MYLITGGARSGKSRYAEALAWTLAEDDVLYIATLSAGDEEMARRVARHRARRPAAWRTLEASLEVPKAVAAATESVLLVDCLSGLVSNVMVKREREGETAAVDAVLSAITELVEALQQSPATAIIVTNEVGSGVVPAYPLGRWYRDALGLANQQLARAADAVCLMSVGLPQTLKGTFPEVDP